MAVDYSTLKKGGFMRQKQKNNFSLRLRVVGGNLTAKQLAKIAEVAENFGDGYVHLTSRQSVEIPFIKLDDVENVKAALAEGDVEPGVCGPRVRTITACQGQAICPSGCIDTYSLAKELDDGQILSVKMNDGEPVQNVPRSIKEEGHQILKLIDNEDGTYNLIVKKVGD
jgi:anaerobic sulfite reductase subunit C